MSSSLLIAGFDVLAPGSTVVLLPDNWDRGAPVPSVAEIQSTVLDGAVVSGLASGNRQPQMTLLIRGTSRAGLAATANQVLMYVNQQSWTMTFTPDGGLPVIYDCFRATSSISSTLLQDAQLTQELTIKCEALPYGRSPTPQNIVLAGGATVIDNYTTKPTMAPTQWNTNTSIVTGLSYNGTTSLRWLSPSAASFPGGTATRTGLSIALSVATQTITLESSISHETSFGAGASWALTVTVGGVNYTSTSTVLPTTLPGSLPYWSAIPFVFATPIPAGTLTAYVLTIPAVTASSGPPYNAQFLFDYLVAYPASGVRGTSTYGNEYILPAVAGSARAPVNIQLTPPSGTFGQMCVHAPPLDTPDSQCLLALETTTVPASVSTMGGIRYRGTYSIWLSIQPSGAVTAGNSTPLTVTQGSTVVTLTHVFTAAEAAKGTQHMLLYFGEVALPLVDLPDSNAQTIAFGVTGGGMPATSLFGDVLVLDTRGQTVLTDLNTPASKAVFVNEPAPGSGFGSVYSSPTAGNLTDAVSISANLLTGAPMWLYPPGNSRLLLWNNTAAPTNILTYYPRWQQEATS